MPSIRSVLFSTALSVAASDPHVVAYVASWEGTNSTALKGVTDAILAFGTTYGGAVSACENKQCTFSADAIAGQSLSQTAAYLKSVSGGGRRALLSFGGGVMGHCKAPDQGQPKGPCTPPPGEGGEVSCWDYCIAAGAESTAQQMVALAQSNGFDGIDLDFESGEDVTAAEAAFLVATTASIRKAWPRAVVSHSAMVTMLMFDGTQYAGVLAAAKDDLDFVGIQFYNDGPCPQQDTAGIATIYGRTVAALGGDASKAVVALAISKDDRHSCYDVATGADACAVLKPLQAAHNGSLGGVCLWEAMQDPLSEWTEAVAQCVGGAPGPAPTPPVPTPPVPTPPAPVPTPPPTPTPPTPSPPPPPPTPPTPPIDYQCLADGSGCAHCMAGTRGPCKNPGSAFPGSCSPASQFSKTGCIGSDVNCCSGSPTPAPPAPTPPSPPTPATPTPPPVTPTPPPVTPTPPPVTPTPPPPTPPALPTPTPTPSPGGNPFYCDRDSPTGEYVCRQSVYGTESAADCEKECVPTPRPFVRPTLESDE